ncbi:MAG: VCBS repeat-containing protein [Vicinamibacteraceae bacterium]
MSNTIGVVMFVGLAVVAGQPARPHPTFDTVVRLETTSEDSANVSMGDLDGDGDLDLVLAKGRHTPLLDRVLINDGKGGFTASDLGPTADRTYTAALVDADGDGDLDVLTSNDTPDEKLVYLNDGKGRFTVAGTWGAGAWSTRNAAMADLNGDGRPDVIAANRPGPSFVCLNQGGGRFAADCIPIPADSATSIVPADFDRDGFVDLAVPSRDGGQSHLYFNDGTAGFARRMPFGPPDAAARAAAAADFDSDGDVDLAIGDERAASMVVYLNDGKGGLAAGFRIADNERTPYAIAAGDLNWRRPRRHRARLHGGSALHLLQRWGGAAFHRSPPRRHGGFGLRIRARRRQRRWPDRHRPGQVWCPQRALPRSSEVARSTGR